VAVSMVVEVGVGGCDDHGGGELAVTYCWWHHIVTYLLQQFILRKNNNTTHTCTPQTVSGRVDPGRARVGSGDIA
jgi:hypothetical protein